MGTRSARSQRKGSFRIAGPQGGAPLVDLRATKAAKSSNGVSISLRHYRQETECFSDWGSVDLKKFAAVVAKLRNYSADTLINSKQCARHSKPPQEKRFRRPEGIADDMPMYEIRVDPGNAARIHGVFDDDVFHLVWLDSKHRVYPQ